MASQMSYIPGKIASFELEPHEYIFNDRSTRTNGKPYRVKAPLGDTEDDIVSHTGFIIAN